MGSSKLSEQCERCKRKDDCGEKHMATCAYINKSRITAGIAASLTQDIAAPISRKHDYRDVWIDANTTITIDLEDLKEQMRRDFYKSVGLPGLDFGA